VDDITIASQEDPMNAQRFDALSQIVTNRWTRRGVAPALLGLAVGSGLLPTLSERANARQKRKKTCGPCQRQKKGRCRGAKPNDTRCGECGVCADGACVPSQLGCPACQECVGDGRCRTIADDALCGDASKCLNGTCNPPPTCGRTGTECNPDVDPECCDGCCSGGCRAIPNAGAFCRQGFAGAPCFETSDCAAQLTCVGYRCA
jgi:hypothetical protein